LRASEFESWVRSSDKLLEQLRLRQVAAEKSNQEALDASSSTVILALHEALGHLGVKGRALKDKSLKQLQGLHSEEVKKLRDAISTLEAAAVQHTEDVKITSAEHTRILKEQKSTHLEGIRQQEEANVRLKFSLKASAADVVEAKELAMEYKGKLAAMEIELKSNGSVEKLVSAGDSQGAIDILRSACGAVLEGNKQAEETIHACLVRDGRKISDADQIAALQHLLNDARQDLLKQIKGNKVVAAYTAAKQEEYTRIVGEEQEEAAEVKKGMFAKFRAAQNKQSKALGVLNNAAQALGSDDIQVVLEGVREASRKSATRKAGASEKLSLMTACKRLDKDVEIADDIALQGLRDLFMDMAGKLLGRVETAEAEGARLGKVEEVYTTAQNDLIKAREKVGDALQNIARLEAITADVDVGDAGLKAHIQSKIDEQIAKGESSLADEQKKMIDLLKSSCEKLEIEEGGKWKDTEYELSGPYILRLQVLVEKKIKDLQEEKKQAEDAKDKAIRGAAQAVADMERATQAFSVKKGVFEERIKGLEVNLAAEKVRVGELDGELRVVKESLSKLRSDWNIIATALGVNVVDAELAILEQALRDSPLTVQVQASVMGVTGEEGEEQKAYKIDALRERVGLLDSNLKTEVVKGALVAGELVQATSKAISVEQDLQRERALKEGALKRVEELEAEVLRQGEELRKIGAEKKQADTELVQVKESNIMLREQLSIEKAKVEGVMLHMKQYDPNFSDISKLKEVLKQAVESKKGVYQKEVLTTFCQNTGVGLTVAEKGLSYDRLLPEVGNKVTELFKKVFELELDAATYPPKIEAAESKARLSEAKLAENETALSKSKDKLVSERRALADERSSLREGSEELHDDAKRAAKDRADITRQRRELEADTKKFQKEMARASKGDPKKAPNKTGGRKVNPARPTTLETRTPPPGRKQASFSGLREGLPQDSEKVPETDIVIGPIVRPPLENRADRALETSEEGDKIRGQAKEVKGESKTMAATGVVVGGGAIALAVLFGPYIGAIPALLSLAFGGSAVYSKRKSNTLLEGAEAADRTAEGVGLEEQSNQQDAPLNSQVSHVERHTDTGRPKVDQSHVESKTIRTGGPTLMAGTFTPN